MDVRLPDGTVIQNVPEGTTRIQLAQKLRANGMNVPNEWLSQPSQPASAAPISRGERFAQGLVDPINGGAQLLTKLLPGSVVKAGNEFNNWLADKTGLVGTLPEGGVDQQVRDQEALYQARRQASERGVSSLVTGEVPKPGFDWMRVAGNVVSPVNLAIASRIPAATTLAGRVGIGATAGAGTSLLNPVTDGENFAAEKGKQLVIGGAAGAAAPLLTGALARVISPNASKNAELQLLKDAGVRPTVGQALGGRMNALEEKAQSLPIVGDAIANARASALEQFNNAAINRATAPIGVKVQGAGQQAVREAGDALSNAYDDALSQIKSVKFDSQFGRDVRQLKGMAQNLTPSMRDKFNATLKDIVGGRTSQAGGMTAETFKKVDSEIGSLASRYSKSSVASEQELGDAFTQLQALLKQQVVRGNPKAAEALAKADEGWANLVRIEGAAKIGKNADGLFTPGQLNTAIQTADSSVRKRAVARGAALMQDLSSAGQKVIGNKVPNSFTTDRALVAGGALGSYFLNPAIPAGLVGGAALYTPPAQKGLLALVSARPELAEPIAEALRKASPGLIPASAQVGLGLLEQ